MLVPQAVHTSFPDRSESNSNINVLDNIDYFMENFPCRNYMQ
jgi:hypothetical protein